MYPRERVHAFFQLRDTRKAGAENARLQLLLCSSYVYVSFRASGRVKPCRARVYTFVEERKREPACAHALSTVFRTDVGTKEIASSVFISERPLRGAEFFIISARENQFYPGSCEAFFSASDEARTSNGKDRLEF